MNNREIKLIDISADYPFHSALKDFGMVIGYALCDANGGWCIVRMITSDGMILLYNPYDRTFYDSTREEIEKIYV